MIFLRGISFQIMDTLLQFMYEGEIRVPVDQMPPLFEVAKDLCIRGLTEKNQRPEENVCIETNTEDQFQDTTNDILKLLLRSDQAKDMNIKDEPPEDNEEIEEKLLAESEDELSLYARLELKMNSVKREIQSNELTEQSTPPTGLLKKRNVGGIKFVKSISTLVNDNLTFEDIENTRKEFMVQQEPGKWKCTKCDYGPKQKSHLWDHVEGHVNHGGYKCKFCENVISYEATLRKHFRSHHDDVKL